MTFPQIMLQLGQPLCPVTILSIVLPSTSGALSNTPSLKLWVGSVPASWHHSTVAMVPCRFQNL